MTKQEYKDLTGEDPEDMYGPDWQNYLEDLMSDKPSHDKENNNSSKT